MPKVTASILEAMDRVAREGAETVGKLLNNNNNSYSTRHSHDQSLFHKLEVSWISAPKPIPKLNLGFGSRYQNRISVSH